MKTAKKLLSCLLTFVLLLSVMPLSGIAFAAVDDSADCTVVIESAGIPAAKAQKVHAAPEKPIPEGKTAPRAEKPARAYGKASANYYDLWLGDTQVTSQNMADILGDGKASYDPETNTLTLNDPTITGEHELGMLYIGAGMGTVTITGTVNMNDGYTYGIYADGSNVIINGTVTLSYASGIVVNGSFTFAGGTLTLEPYDDPEVWNTIYGDIEACDIVISGGTVSGFGYMAATDGDVNITGGEVNAGGGVITAYNDIIVSGGAVTVSYMETQTGNITIENGTVSAENGDEYGICANNDLTISGSSTVTAWGYDYGIYAFNDLTISGSSTVTVEGGEDGIYADSVYIEDGEVCALDDICAADEIRISGGTVTIEDGDSIEADGVLIVSGGTLTLVPYVNPMFERVFGDIKAGEIILSGGTVSGFGSMEATDGDVNISGVEVNAIVAAITAYNDIIVSGAAVDVGIMEADNDITISGAAVHSYGIRTWYGSIMIENSTVTVEGDEIGIGAYDQITISGSSTVTAEGDEYGIYADDQLTISGSCTVTARGGEDGICAYPVSIEGGEVYAYGSGEDGIYANCVSIEGGEVYAYGGKGGIDADEDILIIDGTVTAEGSVGGIIANYVSIEGGEVNGSCIQAFEHEIISNKDGVLTGCGTRVKEGGDIYISGGTVTVDYINAEGEVNISGGTVNADGNLEYGIYADDQLTISGSCTVTARGSEDAIYSYYVSIEGGEVYAYGGELGIEADEDISIIDGIVTAEGGAAGISAKHISIADELMISEPEGGFVEELDGWNVSTILESDGTTIATRVVIEPRVAKHNVTFIDGLTGEVIAVIKVTHGGDAVAPEAPEHAWYLFSGWEGDFMNVTEDVTITATYRMLGDVDGDGQVTSSDAIFVLRYAMQVNGNIDTELADVNGDGMINFVDALLILRHSMQLR